MSEMIESPIKPEKPDKQTLREFSKNVNPITRYNKTLEILQERSSRTSAIKRLDKQIEWEEDNLKLLQPDAGRIETEIKKIDTDFSRIQTNLVLRIFQQGKLERLRQKKQEIEGSEEYDPVKYYYQMKEKLDQLRQTLDLERQHNKAKELLRAFYQNQEADWARYKEDLRESSVDNIIRKYGVVFIHGIRDTGHLKHSFTDTPLSWEDKLFINLIIGPTISTSTIKKGYTIAQMFARCGVILNGGQVTQSSSNDLGSISKDFFSKGYEQAENEHENMAREIKQTMYESDKKIERIKSGESEKIRLRSQIIGDYGVNEFVIRNPKICGLYFCPDRAEPEFISGSFRDIDRPELNRIQDVIEEIKIPFYVIKNGVVYEAKIKNGEIKVLNSVKPEELAQRKYELPEEIRERKLSRLMESCPFKMAIPEVWLVESMAQGKMAYIELNYPRKQDKEVDPRQELASFPSAFETVSFYYDKGGRLVCTKRRAIDQQEKEYFLESDFWGLENGTIYLGYTNEHSDIPITDNKTYLKAMEDIIPLAKERERKYPYAIKERHLDRIAFHLYGFGEQAEINGQQEIKDKAFVLASQILSYEEYLRTIKERVGPHGEFRMIPEDYKN